MGDLNQNSESATEILSSTHFPYGLKSPHKQHFTHKITLSLGSNQGKSIEILERVFRWLAHHSAIQILYTSPIWRNPPFGFTEQNDFYNAILCFSSSLNIVQIYQLIFYIERRFGRGRKRAFKNAPRPLDVDLIFFDEVILCRKYLFIPHKEYDKRASVLLPLSFVPECI